MTSAATPRWGRGNGEERVGKPHHIRILLHGASEIRNNREFHILTSDPLKSEVFHKYLESKLN